MEFSRQEYWSGVPLCIYISHTITPYDNNNKYYYLLLTIGLLDMGHSWTVEIEKRLWGQDGQEWKLVWPRIPRTIMYSNSLSAQSQKGKRVISELYVK